MTLKSLGYSLEEIKDLWDDDRHFPSIESLEEKIKVCKAELEMLKERERMLKAACLKVFGEYGRLYQAFVDLFAWLEKEGYKITGDPRTCYIDGIWNQEDVDKWLTINKSR